jgi:hypothetical protein
MKVSFLNVRFSHTCLQEEGKEQESTRLYFESALKYLHVASTLEPPPSIDGFKQCDAAQNLYSDTAKLCK